MGARNRGLCPINKDSICKVALFAKDWAKCGNREP